MVGRKVACTGILALALFAAEGRVADAQGDGGRPRLHTRFVFWTQTLSPGAPVERTYNENLKSQMVVTMDPVVHWSCTRMDTSTNARANWVGGFRCGSVNDPSIGVFLTAECSPSKLTPLFVEQASLTDYVDGKVVGMQLFASCETTTQPGMNEVRP